MTPKAFLHVLATISLAAATTAHGQSLRCRGDGLIGVGDSKVLVQRTCAEPETREQVCERQPPDRFGNPAPCLDVENWTYRPGYDQFVTTLRFEDGALVRITYGDRQ